MAKLRRKRAIEKDDNKSEKKKQKEKYSKSEKKNIPMDRWKEDKERKRK